MSGLVRCVACGEIQWNLRGKPGTAVVQNCRVCGERLCAERRRPGRLFGARPARERRDARPGAAG